MSNVTIIQTPTSIYIGSDSAVSTTIDGVIYRLHEYGKKLFVYSNKVVFCSGNLDMSYRIMSHVTDASTLEEIQAAASTLYDEQFGLLDMIVCTVENGLSKVYQISPYNNFEIVCHSLERGMAIWTGGIKTREAYDCAYKAIEQGVTVSEVFKHTFDTISYEGIGGTLSVYHLGDHIQLLLSHPIKEKDNVKRFDSVSEAHLIIGERIFGQIFTGNNLIIGDADGIFKLMGNKGVVYDRTGTEVMKIGLYETDATTGVEKFGLRLSNATTRVVMDKDSGFQIARLTGASTWDSVAWLDVNGKLNLKDIIASGTIEATTLSATTKLLVGNIDVTDLVVNGLQPKTDWIKANMIEANTITANKIKAGELIVGTNVTMGPSATLGWTSVTGKPANIAYLTDITWANTSGKPVDLAYLNNIDWTRVKGTVVTQGGIETQLLVVGTTLIGDALIGNLSASKINAGTLNAAYISTDIAQVSSTVSVGGSTVRGRVNLYTPGTARDIYLQAGTDPYGASQLNLVADVVYMKSPAGATSLQFGSGSTIDFTGTTVTGLNLTAKFG